MAMKHNGGNIKLLYGAICIFIVILSANLLLDAESLDRASVPLDPNSVANRKMQEKDMAKRIAGKQVTGNFQPSLEMKENVDFLLTPALLLQEAISEDVVVTYPTE